VTRNEDGVSGTNRAVVDDTITEVLHSMFRIDLESLNTPSVSTDIHFDVETFQTLDEILTQLGLHIPTELL
jgi:hypothetical protein